METIILRIGYSTKILLVNSMHHIKLIKSKNNILIFVKVHISTIIKMEMLHVQK